MPCISVDVMIGVFTFTSSAGAGVDCCSVRGLASTALHGVYPDDAAGYIYSINTLIKTNKIHKKYEIKRMKI